MSIQGIGPVILYTCVLFGGKITFNVDVDLCCPVRHQFIYLDLYIHLQRTHSYFHGRQSATESGKGEKPITEKKYLVRELVT